MVSCHWVQPAQLHPWFKPDSLKRKLPSMLLRSESPSPVDEDDPDTDSRVKRQRLPTFALEHRRPGKRKLPSCLQTPTEEEEGNLTGARPLTTKRQRSTVLEHGFERLSLTPPSYPATQAAAIPVVPLPAPAVPPEFGFSSSASQQWWVDVPAASAPPIFQQISSPTAVPVLPAASAPALSADVLDDVRMRSSSWYEPEKDRACVCPLLLEPPPLTLGRQGSSSPIWTRRRTTNEKKKKTARALRVHRNCRVPCCRRCCAGTPLRATTTYRGCCWLGCWLRRSRLCGRCRRCPHHRYRHLSWRASCLGLGRQTRRWMLSSELVIRIFLFGDHGRFSHPQPRLRSCPPPSRLAFYIGIAILNNFDVQGRMLSPAKLLNERRLAATSTTAQAVTSAE